MYGPENPIGRLRLPYKLQLLMWKIFADSGEETLFMAVMVHPPKAQFCWTFSLRTRTKYRVKTCNCILLVGNSNPNKYFRHLIKTTLNSLLAIYDMDSHVIFVTHISGSSLDLVVGNLPLHVVQWPFSDQWVTLIPSLYWRRRIW